MRAGIQMTDATYRGPASGSSSTEQRFRKEKRHSRNVRWLKIALPALAVLMTLGLVGKSVIASMGDVRIDLLNSTIEGGKLIMANPKVEGVNSLNRRYEVSAARAIQDITNGNRVDLEEIFVRVPMGTDQWAEIRSQTGSMYRQQNVVALTSPMRVETTDGLVADFRLASLNMATGDFLGKEEVKVERDGSTITSQSVSILDGGTRLLFQNNVKVSIRPGPSSPAPVSNGESNGGQ